MQYFMALKMGEKRVKAAKELLTRYAGHAMPALALKDNKDNKWEPVGEETLYAIIREDAGYMIAFCDRIMDLQGDFQVLEFTVGKKKVDPSHARLLVKGKNKEHLERILEQVYREGAQPVTVQETRLEPAPRNMVMPDDFYSTTNNATQVYHGGQWIDVQNMMMDKCIVVDIWRKTAEC